MFGEVDDLDVVFFVCLVSDDEAAVCELLQHSAGFLYGYVVVSEQRLFDFAGSIFQPSFSVGDAPESNKQKPCQGFEVAEDVVVKKGRLDVSGSCHFRFLLSSAYIYLRSGQLLHRLFEAVGVAVVVAQMQQVYLLDVS